MANNFKKRANSIADLLRGDYKQSEYGRGILPLTVLRRLDCVLEPTKKIVMNYLPQAKGLSPETAGIVLKKKAKFSFFNKTNYSENNIPQKELTQKFGVVFSTVNRWLNGKSKPKKIKSCYIEKSLRGKITHVKK